MKITKCTEIFIQAESKAMLKKAIDHFRGEGFTQNGSMDYDPWYSKKLVWTVTMHKKIVENLDPIL